MKSFQQSKMVTQISETILAIRKLGKSSSIYQKTENQ